MAHVPGNPRRRVRVLSALGAVTVLIATPILVSSHYQPLVLNRMFLYEADRVVTANDTVAPS